MMNIAVIGLGMGREHLRAYSLIPEVRILAIADLDEGRLRPMAEQYRVPQAYTDYRELLALKEFDLVSVCLPNYLHAPVTMEALKAGKHVLVEKPMAMFSAEAEAMIATAKEQRRTLAVSMNYRWAFNPDAFYLKHLIAQGKLGSIYYIRSVSLRRRTFVRGQKSWFSDKKRSGGAAVMDMGPHMVDLAMWFADDYAPVQVSGVTRTAIMVDTDVDDFASALIRLQGGATIALESTWESFTRPGLSLTVLGTRGGAILNLGAPQGQRLTLFGEDDNTLLEAIPVDIRLPTPPEATVQEHVVRSIRAGRQPENSAERGLAVMRVLEAIYQSSAVGRDVVLA
jgi:predicted dehydrogenase